MKLKIITISAITLFLLCGCGNNSKYPTIQEYGEDDFIYDDFTFEVLGAKRGLKGYEILETDNGIDVILHYDKYEEEQK